jgi:hypothetical protein
LSYDENDLAMLLTFVFIFLFQEDFLGGGAEKGSLKGSPGFLRANRLGGISQSRGNRKQKLGK